MEKKSQLILRNSNIIFGGSVKAILQLLSAVFRFVKTSDLSRVRVNPSLRVYTYI